MKKYIALIVVVLSGIILFNVAFDEPKESQSKTVQAVPKKESLPHTDKKIEEPLQEEKNSETVITNKKQVQKSKEERQVSNTSEKPKRKLLGGADVYFIEPQESKKHGRFGTPPM